MPCYSPLTGWRGPKGKLVFKRSDACGFKQVVSCGQCIGCRLERSRQWAIRIMHESSEHDVSSFVTLTYKPEKLPASGSLLISDFQGFMKRLRRRTPRAIRFFHCGEYGEECQTCGLSRLRCLCYQFSRTFGRPHYHAIIFGYDFPDKVFYKESNGERWYESEFLDDVWAHGMCIIGNVSFESAGYVARYCLKKRNGHTAYEHYWKLSEVTGECFQIAPEYSTMSKGIGSTWFEEFHSDVFPRDEVVLRGHVSQPPRFYDKLYEVLEPDDFDRIKRKRILASRRRPADSTPARLEVREQVKLAQVSTFLHRSYENDS